MSILLVAIMQVKDGEKLAEYRKVVGPMVRARGGELVVKAKKQEDLKGISDDGDLLIFRFADEATFRSWWDSPEYAELIPLRDAGSSGVFTLYTE
ncbi:MAG: hypothetical protein DRQ60_07455 [Gammaproteobacteria bacterium]|nr:MAG: hypothetical protein DRQ54_00880 [Gammaproteobacteria bacterium]RLA13565.1 MAG: hypothetical protein DRQ60_07455 [Gammaproteobacteria bacterium]RLA15960.1 MAG: hypothetical protein DRQ52_00630 [Gammaproteobacteria bacterium]